MHLLWAIVTATAGQLGAVNAPLLVDSPEQVRSTTVDVRMLRDDADEPFMEVTFDTTLSDAATSGLLRYPVTGCGEVGQDITWDCPGGWDGPLRTHQADGWVDATANPDPVSLRDAMHSRNAMTSYDVPVSGHETVRARVRDRVFDNPDDPIVWTLGLGNAAGSDTTVTVRLPLTVPVVDVALVPRGGSLYDDGGPTWTHPADQRIADDADGRHRTFTVSWPAAEVPEALAIRVASRWPAVVDSHALRDTPGCPLALWNARPEHIVPLSEADRRLCRNLPYALYGRPFQSEDLDVFFYGSGRYPRVAGYQPGDEHAFQRTIDLLATPTDIWHGTARIGTGAAPTDVPVLAHCGERFDAYAPARMPTTCDWWLTGMPGISVGPTSASQNLPTGFGGSIFRTTNHGGLSIDVSGSIREPFRLRLSHQGTRRDIVVDRLWDDGQARLVWYGALPGVSATHGILVAYKARSSRPWTHVLLTDADGSWATAATTAD